MIVMTTSNSIKVKPRGAGGGGRGAGRRMVRHEEYAIGCCLLPAMIIPCFRPWVLWYNVTVRDTLDHTVCEGVGLWFTEVA